MRFICTLLGCLLAVLALAAGPQAQSAAPDIVLTNGRIFTGVASKPWVDALSITGEHISAVGTNDAVSAKSRANTRVIGLQGRLVIPGFNDAHALSAPGRQANGSSVRPPPSRIRRSPRSSSG